MTNCWKVGAAAAVLMGLAAASAAQGRITNVEITTTESAVEVLVSGTGLTKPKELRILGGLSYIAEFDANLGIKPINRRVRMAGVRDIEVVWFQPRPPKVRVHLRLDAGQTPKLEQRDGNWVISVSSGGARPLQANDMVLPPIQPAGTLPKPQADSKTRQQVNPFPDVVPTLEPVAQPRPQGAIQAPRAQAPVAPSLPQGKRVTVDFVSTDVVQILKALSIEAGVNIITAPDVSPSDKPTRLTVSLRNASLEDALAYVTVMANLRYAKLNNTFFVTPASTFSQTMRSIFERGSVRFETRVVNLMSGEAGQIRAAVLAAKPQDGAAGFYDIQDPFAHAAPLMQVGAQAPQQPPTQQGGPQTAGGQPQQSAPMQQQAQKVNFLMLVGEPRRLDEISGYIRELDQQIARSFSVNRGDDMGSAAVPIQSGQATQVKEMILKLLENNPRRSEFSISETALRELAEGELPTTMLLMIGPKTELDALRAYAEAMDEQVCRLSGITFVRGNENLTRAYEVVELKHIEPQIAAFDLKNRVRGLYVTVLPDPVTPGLTGTVKDEKQDQTKAAAGTEQAQGGEKDKQEKSVGREPMKLILRGTRTMIDEAKQYLAMVDIAPRQIALELRVMELTKEEAQRIGINWGVVTGGRLTKFDVTQGISDTTGAPSSFGGAYNFRGADVVNFLATLDRLNGGRNIISRPNALLSDGRPYNLFVGDTIRYVESVQAGQNGVTVQTNSLDVGVTFNVVGRIGADNSLALNMQQKFTILNGFTPVPGGGQLPQTSERRSENFVNMKAGEAVAFGGLIQEQDRKRVSGIPLLMDLPIIGQLFKRTDTSKVKTEIVFIMIAVPVDEANRPDAAKPKQDPPTKRGN